MKKRQCLLALSIAFGMGAGWGFCLLALSLFSTPDLPPDDGPDIEPISLQNNTTPPPPDNPRKILQEQQIIEMDIPLPQLNVPSLQSNLNFALPKIRAINADDLTVLPEISVIPSEPSASDNFGSTVNAKLTFKPNLDSLYPRRARSRGIEGKTKVSFIVAETGRVDPESIAIISSNPPGYFEKASRKAIGRCKFEPAKFNGELVAQRKELNLEWTLRK